VPSELRREPARCGIRSWSARAETDASLPSHESGWSKLHSHASTPVSPTPQPSCDQFAALNRVLDRVTIQQRRDLGVVTDARGVVPLVDATARPASMFATRRNRVPIAFQAPCAFIWALPKSFDAAVRPREEAL
jgi:hypothetical protein